MSCMCVRCQECSGSGTAWVDNPDGYPEREFEVCSECGGTGFSEICDECQEDDERNEVQA